MSHRGACWLAWSIFALSTAIALAGLILHYQNWNTPWNYGGPAQLRITAATDHALFLIFPAIGAWLASRRPENPIGWLFSATGLCVSALLTSHEYFVYASLTRPSVPGDEWAAWVYNVTHFPVLLPVALVLLLFPDGRLLSHRWRPAAVFVILASATAVAAAAFTPDLCVIAEDNPDIGCTPNPIRVPEPMGRYMLQIGDLGWALMPAVVAVATVPLVLRFLGAGTRERQQIKWLASAGALVAASTIANVLARGLSGTAADIAKPLSVFVLGLSIAGLPVATAIAILRYRLYEIDRIINRALVYGALTATLIATYLLLILALGAFGRQVAGYDSTIGVAISTLAVAALVRPFGSRIQSAVDQRFYRSRYDATRTVEAFSIRLRDEIDLPTLEAELQTIVAETMQPEHVSLWLRPAGERR